MSDLDKKLDEILDYMGSSYYPGHEYPESYEPQNIELRKEALPQIKQAFIDAGWFEPGSLAPYYTEMIRAYTKAGGAADCVLMSRKDWDVNSKLSGMMTGQEWLDRFEDELMSLPRLRINRTDHFTVRYHEVADAARKASGVAG